MKIYRGKQTPEHKGDTSRELLSMWEESGYCEVIDGETNDVFLWANKPGDVLLYEYDRYDVYPWLPPSWNGGLFAVPDHPEGVPWILWARHPRQLETKIQDGIKTWDNRQTESVFLGKIENRVQYANRVKYDWSACIEEFSMPVMMGDSLNWPYTQQQYLEILSNSKFGLSLPGYGPRGNREIEYLGLGVVPLISDGVSTTYYNPLIEGKHFLRVKSPEHLREVLQNCSQAQWEFLSYNGRQWYEENCSRLGSFETTKRIIEGLK
jgi:hypothetical protein